jgi:aminopeptidase N
MAGFYRSRYKPKVSPAKSVPQVDDFHYMFSTQFESCDARRAFPCFDEPNLKATFDVDLEIPSDQVALSNMPEKKGKEAKEGWKIVSFETTPIMSTYLLAWAVGDFEFVEDRTELKYDSNDGKRIPVRVYTTRGLRHQGEFALENAKKIVDYFSEVRIAHLGSSVAMLTFKKIFDIEYPLPKVDLLAVHEFVRCFHLLASCYTPLKPFLYALLVY